MGRDGRNRRKHQQQRNRLTAEDRAQFARERKALVGRLITQKGWEGALIVEHIRGSQYLVRLPNGQETYASHKKQKGQLKNAFVNAGWELWEER